MTIASSKIAPGTKNASDGRWSPQARVRGASLPATALSRPVCYHLVQRHTAIFTSLSANGRPGQVTPCLVSLPRACLVAYCTSRPNVASRY